MDNHTLDGDYGHFARVLIHVDLTKPYPPRLELRRKVSKYGSKFDMKISLIFVKSVPQLGTPGGTVVVTNLPLMLQQIMVQVWPSLQAGLNRILNFSSVVNRD